MAIENKEATLTHKVRNPQNLDSWLDIWTATVSADFDENNNNRTNETIVIAPSNNWQIPVTKIVDTDDTYNVTTSSPIGSNVLIKTDGDGNLIAGPAAPTSNGDATYFLNQKGQWAQVDTSFTVNLEKITVNNQEEETTPNAEFKVGNKSVIVKPKGKLAFSNVVNNETIDLSLGSIGTEDIKEKTIKLGNLDLEGLNDPNDPNSGIEFILPAENIADIPATQIINFDTAVNSAVKTNTKTDAGIVTAGNNYTSRGWLTDSNGNPSWRKVTADHMDKNLDLNDKLKNNSISSDKLNTKLLGVWIDDVSPVKYNVNEIVVTDNVSYEHSVTDSPSIYTVTYVLTASPSTTVKGASWTVEVIWNNNELLTTITDQRDNNPLFNMENPATIFPKISYILYDIQNYNSPFYIEFPYATIEELKEFFKSSNFAQKLRYSLNSHINTIDGNAAIEAVPINERLYIDDFIPEYMLSEWDYEHCGIWVEI